MEEIYLKEYHPVAEAVSGMNRYFRFYKDQQLRQVPGNQVLAEDYGGTDEPSILCVQAYGSYRSFLHD